MKKAIIESSSVKVLDFFSRVSKAAKKEKEAKINLNRMAYWWTHKPLVVGRAMVLASMFDKLDDVEQFLGMKSEKPYDYRPNLDDFAQKTINTKPIKVLDPFGGSGNLAFPAVQLNLDVTVSDYNPFAWLVEKGALEFPIIYDSNLQDDFVKYANRVIEETKKEVGKYFSDSHLTYLWCWCIRCNHCSQRFPLTNHMYIVKTPKRRLGIRIIPDNGDFTIELVEGISDNDGKKYTQKGGKAVCISCTNPISHDVMTKDITKYKDREMIAIQIQKRKNRDYVLPTNKDKKIYNDAIQYFKTKYDEFDKQNLIPKEKILASISSKNTLWNCGINTWDQYFDERQMLVLCTFMKNIKNICGDIPNESSRKIIVTYLSFVLAKRVDNAGFGVRWHTVAIKPESILSMRRPSIAYNFAESNPFAKIGGSITNIIQSVSRTIKFTERLQTPATCKNESVTTSSDEQYDLIITDPPYGDDVQYGELSEFFYVWVYRILKEYYDLPPRIPLDEDYCESRGRFTSKKMAKEFFGSGLKKSFKSMNNKLKDDGLLVVLFAHSSTEAWNQFLAAVQEAKLRIVSSYAIHTEMSTNVLARNKASFMSSIMVTCRKITKESVQFFEDLIPQIDDSVKKILDDIPDQRLLSLPITDLLIMVYGKVLEVSTQHTQLKSYEKDFVPDFELLIKNARSTIIRELVVKLLQKQPDIIGSKMAFYIIIKIFNNGLIPADDALKIAQAYNTSIDSMSKDGVITQKDGMTCLEDLKRNMDYKPDKIDPQDLYQQLCYLVSNQSDVAKLLHHENIRTNDLKPIVDLLIKNYSMKRNQNHILTQNNTEEKRILNSIASHMGITIDPDDYRLGFKKVTTKKDRAKKSMGDEKQSRLEKWK